MFSLSITNIFPWLSSSKFDRIIMEWKKRGCVIQTLWDLEKQRLFDSGLSGTQHPRLIRREKSDPFPQIPDFSLGTPNCPQHWPLLCALSCHFWTLKLSEEHKWRCTSIADLSLTAQKCCICTGMKQPGNFSSSIHLTSSYCKRIAKLKIRKVWADLGKQFKCKYQQLGAKTMKLNTWTLSYNKKFIRRGVRPDKKLSNLFKSRQQKFQKACFTK